MTTTLLRFKNKKIAPYDVKGQNYDQNLKKKLLISQKIVQDLLIFNFNGKQGSFEEINITCDFILGNTRLHNSHGSGNV